MIYGRVDPDHMAEVVPAGFLDCEVHHPDPPRPRSALRKPVLCPVLTQGVGYGDLSLATYVSDLEFFSQVDEDDLLSLIYLPGQLFISVRIRVY